MSGTPVDNLVRARYGADTIEMRADDSGEEGRTLFGHFAVFDSWTEIDSAYEGRFLERVAYGSFADAFADPSGVRVLYEHGADPQIGSKPIAAPDVLREDDTGAYYEATLFDADYANQLLPALRSNQLGASFRFRVTGEEWVQPRSASDENPKRLPERTITGVSLYEFGPVTWGAYPDATAGVRSNTDAFIERLMSDSAFMARFTERAGLHVVEKVLEGVRADGPALSDEGDSADGQSQTMTTSRTQRAARVRRARWRNERITS